MEELNRANTSSKSDPSPNDQKTYRLSPLAVSAAFYQRLLDQYPALACKDRKGLAYRRIAQYVLFNNSFQDEDTDLTILPYTTVAALVGVHPRSHAFCALRWMDDFSRDVFPLNPSDYRYVEEKARTVEPVIADDIAQSLSAESQRIKPAKDCVWLDTGASVSRRNRRERQEEYETGLQSYAASISKDHPAFELASYLQQTSQGALKRVQRRNWPAVIEAVGQMPPSTSKSYCEGLLIALQGHPNMFYAPSEYSPRINAIGVSIHQLPSPIRKIALAGGVEFDLRSAQLAIVARQWGIDPLYYFLKGDRSIWGELANHVQLPVSEYKPMFKRTVYATIFGMSKGNLHADLENKIGKQAADLFFKHPLILALLKARQQSRKWVWQEGYALDAWYHPISLPGKRAKSLEIYSVLSQAVQSYELRLMLAAFKVIQRKPQVYLLSWLHDGIVIEFGNKTKQAGEQQQILRAVKKEAKALCIPTELEINKL
jgi:hypothetical protein